MPFKSKAQRRKFYALKAQGKMDQKTIDKWESKTPLKIPEKLASLIDTMLGYSQEEKDRENKNEEFLPEEEKQAALTKSHLKLIDGHIAHNKSNDSKKSLRIVYKKLNGRTVKRKIDPYVLKNGLLIGFDHKRKATRSFKLDRFKDLEKVASLKKLLNLARSRTDDVFRIYSQNKSEKNQEKKAFYEAFEKAAYEWNGESAIDGETEIIDLKKSTDRFNVRRDQETQDEELYA